MANDDFKKSPFYTDPMQRFKYYGKQFPDGSKPQEEIDEELKWTWTSNGWVKKDEPKQDDPQPPVQGPPVYGPNAPNPFRDALIGTQQPAPPSNALTDAFGITPQPTTFFPPMPGSPQVPQSTMVPGLGGPWSGTAPALPADLPPLLAAQFKDNAAAQGALLGSPYQDLGKLKVWAGGKAVKDIPYGGSLASPSAAAAGTDQYKGIAAEASTDPGGTPVPVDEVSGAQYMDMWFNMDPKTKQKYMDKFVKAGILTAEQASSNALGSDADTFGQRVWASLIQNASLQWQTAGTRITPIGVLDQALAKGTSAIQTTKTSVDKAFSISDGMTANKALSQMLTDRLGRLPTKAEKAAFLSALNAYERANPSVRTTTSNLITGDSTSTSKGGADSAAFAAQYGEDHNKKEYGAVQGATTYYKAFMDLIGA